MIINPCNKAITQIMTCLNGPHRRTSLFVPCSQKCSCGTEPLLRSSGAGCWCWGRRGCWCWGRRGCWCWGRRGSWCWGRRGFACSSGGCAGPRAALLCRRAGSGGQRGESRAAGAPLPRASIIAWWRKTWVEDSGGCSAFSLTEISPQHSFIICRVHF